MEDNKYLMSFFRMFILVTLLSGCETHVGPDELDIIGIPPSDMFYDAAFEFQFGVSGGEGPFSYRYIQNPEDIDEQNNLFNTVELTIEVTNDTKPSFWLRGVPTLPDGDDPNSLATKNFKYQLEVRGGGSVKVVEYEFTLKKNSLSLNSGNDVIATEGVVSNSVANSLILQRKSGFDFVCKSATDRLYEKTTLPNGTTVYPITFVVELFAATSTPIELFYRFESDYQSNFPERAPINIGLARPNVDYLDEQHSVKFESGEFRCLLFLNALDDALIEGEEKLRVVFTEKKGGMVNFEGEREDIIIRDDEPLPAYRTGPVTRSEGDNIQGIVSLSTPYKHPLSINIGVDSEHSTVSADDYILTPENGVLTIPAGEISASYSVSLLHNQDDVLDTADDIISIVTDIDEISDVEPFQISINEWPLNGDLDMEIVAISSDNEKAVDMAVDSEGTVTVLVEDFSDQDEKRIVVRGFRRDGTPFDLTGSGPIKLAKPGTSIRPVVLLSTGSKDLIVVAEVDGLFADVHRGGTDFVVAVYKKNNLGVYTNQLLRQFGSDGNDSVSGANIDERGGLYVHGKTSGSGFEGEPGSEINKGGEDGFVYKIDFGSGEVRWSRFIGSTDQDSVVSLDAGRRDVLALTSRQRTDLDAFVRTLVESNGEDNDDVVDGVISSSEDDDARLIRFSKTGSNHFILVNSEAVLPEGNATPTRSQDVNMLVFNTNGEFSGVTSLSTGQTDVAVDFELLSKEGNPVVVGQTDGEFIGNKKLGTDGTDAFISVMALIANANTRASLDFTEEGTLQFGTPGNDFVIDVKEVSERKFLVLWGEDFTEGNGAIRYRISAFSPEGEKLSPNP